MNSGRIRLFLPLALAGLIAARGFAYSSRNFIYRLPDIERQDSAAARFDSIVTEDSIIPAVSMAPEDTLQRYVDSILTVNSDSIDASFTMLEVDDSLGHIVDSALRAIFVRDSTEAARIEFQKWFDSLPKKEQKRWMQENVILPRKIHEADSILARKDSIKAVKDSITQATPRVLSTAYLPDSLYYKRILTMTRDMEVGNIRQEKFDTSFNYHFYDYPFFRKDINATWLGISGSPVQTYNIYNREKEENATFFTPYRSWSESPENTLMYNTKTPYTELAYWGTPFSGDKKEELNVRVLATQNITPRLNLTLGAEKFSGNGHMQNSTTSTRNLKATMSYLGDIYAVHGGWLASIINRTESGGFRDNGMIRDTTVDSREIEVNLASASNTLRKNTVFLNQSWRISFGNDSLTTAFIGHTLDFSVYKKIYADKITDIYGKTFYNDVFLIDPTSSADTMKVMKLDNRVFMRLQPWKDGSLLSKIDVGIGDKVLFYTDYVSSDTFKGLQTVTLNNIYAYAGLKGMFKEYFNWNARGRIYFAGHQAGDFDVDAAMTVNFYPFRKARKSPLSISVNFHTDLTEPDHYEKRILANHFAWENDFSKQSTTRVGGRLDIPHWKLSAEVGYSLLANSLYYDKYGIIRQSPHPVNVISADIRKEFVLWWFHFDNHVLVQYSSNQEVYPTPLVSLNLRYFFEFPVVKNVMKMQIGASCLFDTKWMMPDYNPELGVFFNQTDQWYGCSPYIDVFLNIQWKRACIFVKLENANQGWPKPIDYFTANNYIHAQRGVKFGIFWPFYILPGHAHKHDHDHAGGNSPHGNSSPHGGKKKL